MSGNDLPSGWPLAESCSMEGASVAFAAASSSDRLVAATAADGAPGVLLDKLAAGDGIDLAAGPGGSSVVVSSMSPLASPYGQELYSYGIGETEGTIPRSTGGTDASGTRGFAFIPSGSVVIRRMRVAIRNVGGSWLRLGIYDAAGNLVSKTARFSPLPNAIVTSPLLADAPLVGGQVYYMAYWSDDSTGNIQFSLLSGRSVSTRSLMQRCDPNEMPANIASGFQNTDLRPWLMVSG